MRTSNRNNNVSFDKMIALLNKGMDKYLEELGPKKYKNPSFVFIKRN